MSDSGSGSEEEQEYEVEAIINYRSEGNKIFLELLFLFIFRFTVFMIMDEEASKILLEILLMNSS